MNVKAQAGRRSVNQKNAPSMSEATPVTVSASHPALTLHASHGELRVDSRIIAKHLGVQRHQDTFELIKHYTAKFQKLGFLLFKTGEIRGRGQPERYALLNEDQAYFLLNLSRNTERVVDLKLELVIAFRDARSKQTLHSNAYLPGYHALHDEVALLAQRAKEAGSQTDEAIFHININKLVNKTAGVEAGSRDRLTHVQKLMVANAQTVIRNTVHRAIQAGESHKTAYQFAKSAVEHFTASAGYLLAGV